MKRYRVEKIDGEMIVVEDNSGKYRAASSEEIRRALTEPRYRTLTAEVQIGKKWHPLRPWDKRNWPARREKPKRVFSQPEPIKGLTSWQRILKKLGLYKDPLEALIYKGEKK